MTPASRLMVAALAALYLLWLGTWIVFGGALYGPRQHYWDQAATAGAVGLAALFAARRTLRPYSGFLGIEGIAFLLLAAAWATYQGTLEPSAAADSRCGVIQRPANDQAEAAFLLRSTRRRATLRTLAVEYR